MGDQFRPAYARREDRYDRRRQDAEYPRDGYVFRGAAADYSRPQETQPQFTFRAPAASSNRSHEYQPPAHERRDRSSRPNRGRGVPSGGVRRGRGGRPFVPKPAHDRALLKQNGRSPTPEQLAGMNVDEEPRYVQYISSDNGDASDSEADHAADEGTSRKRTKTKDNADSARPTWSNPDPYSVLPPTDLGIGPKKDIVSVIRKSKAGTSGQNSGTNALKDNADYISFNDFGDDNIIEIDDDEDYQEVREIVSPPLPPRDLIMPTDVELMEMHTGGKNKRKRGVDQSSSLGGIVDEWRPIPGTNATPWFKPFREFESDVGRRLHDEILDFWDYVNPYKHEIDLRNDLIDRVERAIRSFGKNSAKNIEIRSFGSFAADLYLPDADMDLVSLSPGFMQDGVKCFGHTKNHVFALTRYLRTLGIAEHQSIVSIVGAKVPLVKFVDRETGIKVDVSFENDSGLYAIRTFQQWKQEYPDMPYLVVLIKQFLALRGLNEVHSGGIGGFTTICLVVSMMQHMTPDERANIRRDCRFADLLLRFFNLYGNKFDMRSNGITMEPPGFFHKARYNGRARINPTGLTIIDPNREDNDISGGSRQVEVVFRCFSDAHSVLQQRVNQMDNGNPPNGSILECLLGGNYSSFSEIRSRLDDLDRRLSGNKSKSWPRRSSPRSGDCNYSSAPQQASRQHEYQSQSQSQRTHQLPFKPSEAAPQQNQHQPQTQPQPQPQPQPQHTHQLPSKPSNPVPDLQVTHAHSARPQVVTGSQLRPPPTTSFKAMYVNPSSPADASAEARELTYLSNEPKKAKKSKSKTKQSHEANNTAATTATASKVSKQMKTKKARHSKQAKKTKKAQAKAQAKNNT